MSAGQLHRPRFTGLFVWFWNLPRGQKCAGALNNPKSSEMVVKSEVSQGALLRWPKLKALPTRFPDCSPGPVHTGCAAGWL